MPQKRYNYTTIVEGTNPTASLGYISIAKGLADKSGSTGFIPTLKITNRYIKPQLEKSFKIVKFEPEIRVIQTKPSVEGLELTLPDLIQDLLNTRNVSVTFETE